MMTFEMRSYEHTERRFSAGQSVQGFTKLRPARLNWLYRPRATVSSDDIPNLIFFGKMASWPEYFSARRLQMPLLPAIMIEVAELNPAFPLIVTDTCVPGQWLVWFRVVGLERDMLMSQFLSVGHYSTVYIAVALALALTPAKNVAWLWT
jgi:hypothetical protein